MTRFLREAFTLLFLTAGLIEILHWMMVGLSVVDPTRIPQ